MANVLLMGNGAREHVIAEALMRSKHDPKLFSYMKSNNPGIASLSDKIVIGSYDDLEKINQFAIENEIDFAIIGPEDPLANGVVDSLNTIGIPSVGPTRDLARLETSKTFTRNLLQKYNIPGNPRYRVFTSLEGIKEFVSELDGIVIKPDGL
ncbi:MAG: phosphoribosylamine--glycine ligase, partial [Thermodesulfobacteriota bacterium]|nr:phosphoribosylamine--glycine ligase [Thermodesulfobacteriota bacterium]